ncbi:MAG: MFS transporter [Candidatus Humimicrobiaceae bacterium]
MAEPQLIKVKKDSFIDYLSELPNYFSNFLIPVYFTTASTMLIEMAGDLKVSVESFSIIFTYFVLGSVIGQLTSVLYNRKFKKLIVLLSSYMFIILILLSLFFAHNIYVFYMLFSLLGYFSGVILIQSTKYVLENSIKNKGRIMTIMLCFYPIGSLTAPFIATSLIRRNIDWRFSFIIMAVLTFFNVVLFVIVKGRRSKFVSEAEDRVSFKKIFFDRRLNKLFLFGLSILFFYSVTETVMATWVPTFLRISRSFDISYAGYAVSIVWIGILIGRIAVSIIAGRYNENYIMMALAILALISLIIFTLVGTVNLSLIFSFFIGLGLSGLGPLTISSSSTLYEKGRGVLVSIIFAANNFAISMTPLLTRAVSGHSMTLSVSIASIFMFLLIAALFLKIIFERKSPAI